MTDGGPGPARDRFDAALRCVVPDLDAREIGPRTRLRDDLGLDGAALCQLALILEPQLDSYLPDDLLDSLETVDDWMYFLTVKGL